MYMNDKSSKINYIILRVWNNLIIYYSDREVLTYFPWEIIEQIGQDLSGHST